MHCPEEIIKVTEVMAKRHRTRFFLIMGSELPAPVLKQQAVLINQIRGNEIRDLSHSAFWPGVIPASVRR